MMNICIVGYGTIGPVHAQSLKDIKNAVIYGICDIEKSKADAGAKLWKCKSFYDFEDVLQDASVDAIHICTPHYLHYSMICQALDAGKMVVSEKPLTMTKEEYDTVLKNYAKAPLYPVLQNRTNHCVVKMKEIIDTDNTIGKLQGIRGFVTWKRNKAYYDSAAWRGTVKYEGGGVLINQAVHTLDLMSYFSGGFSEVCATASNKSLQGVIEVEDTIDARLITKSGAVGLFYASNGFSASIAPQIDLYFENKTYHYAEDKLYCNNELICTNDKHYLGKDCYGMGHAVLFSNIYDEKDKYIRLSDTINTMHTMFAIYQSAIENGSEIKL